MRWSYSSVNCYYQCPAKFKFRYIDGIRGLPSTSPAMERGTKVHSDFETCLRDESYVLAPPFDYYGDFMCTLRDNGAKAEHVITLDKHWKPTAGWEPIWVKSILDVSLIQGNVARNYDWKTGGIYDDHKEQRELYSLMQFCENPEVEIVIGTHVYLDKKENRSNEFTRDQVPALKAKWEEKVRPLYEDEVFPTNPSYACRWCEFSRYNGGPCRF